MFLKIKEKKNILSGVYKSEQHATGHLEWFDQYGVENLHTYQSQYSIEGASTEGILLSFLQTNHEEQRQKSVDITSSHHTKKNEEMLYL